MSIKDVILVGYSGHGFVVASAAMQLGYTVKYYTDIKPSKLNPFNLEYLGFESSDDFLGWEREESYILGIGDNHIRKKAADNILAHNKNILNVMHPTLSISNTVRLGKGNFFAKNVSIPPLVTIGDFNILNTGCIVEHECSIGNTVHIGPGAVLTGKVEVGDFSFIGANAVVKQGVKIGKNVIVGAGTVVLQDIPDNETVVGNPGKTIIKPPCEPQ